MSTINQSHPYLDGIAKQLLDYTRQCTEDTQTQPLRDTLSASEASNKEEKFKQAVAQAASLTPDEKLHAARALAAERIVLNALGNMYRRMETPTPRERFADYFTRALKGASPEEQKAFIDTLQQARDKMIISVVQTMHPTIYHTEFARKYETELTTKLEEIAAGLRGIPKNERDNSVRNQQRTIIDNEIKANIGQMVADIMSGKESVTPEKQVTVVAENNLDRFNHIQMQKEFANVVTAYNDALESVSKTLQVEEKLEKSLAEQMRGAKIDKSQAVWRTWAYGADADGRDLSTSIVLYDGIYHHVHDGKYIGRKRDLRENAKDQKQSVSCLIQRAYLSGLDNFKTYCGQFLEDHKDTQDQRIDWKNAGDSTVLQLSEKEQTDFYRSLITGYTDVAMQKKTGIEEQRLVPPSLKEQTIAFNEMFAQEYRKFLKNNGKEVPQDSPLPDLSTLSHEQLVSLAEIIAATPVKCGKGEQEIHFALDVSNGDGRPPSLLYSAQEGENSNFFENAKKTVFAEEVSEGKTIRHATNEGLEGKERRKLLDVVKRLQILDHAHDNFGDKVADRYQVANFENASDFYASLLLFKETGIITIGKDGLIQGKPKLSLQPLLETEQDQANAPALFSKLLEDPLVRSYYQALGNHAQMMVGYSDGAKSAGNLASEWSILKCERNLKAIFEQHGIKLTFFHGRGRGDSRGGQFDEGQNYRAAAPELHQDMRYDETIQSDGPMNGAISKARGEDMLASIVEAVIGSKRESDVELTKRKEDPAYNAQQAAREAAINSIAETSKNEYLRLVGNNPATTQLLGVVPDNDFKSSRAKSRKADMKFEDLRAISVEYGFAMADAPLHYIGMQKALKNFIDSGQSVPGANGHPVSGARALEVLYQTTPFFRKLFDKTEQGLREYDPTVFRGYAKAAGIESWAEECIGELNGLKEMTHTIRTQEATKQAMRDIRDRQSPERPKPLAGRLSMGELGRRERLRQDLEARAYDALRSQGVTLDKAADALALSAAYKEGGISQVDPQHNPLHPKDNASTDAKTMRTIAFLKSESNRTKGVFPPAPITAVVEQQPFLAR